MARASAIATEMVERAPEADRLADFPHPRETLQLFGQQSAEQELLRAFQTGRMPHAWLLNGPDGIGKATLAYRFARFAFANPDGATADEPHDLSVPQDHPVVGQVNALSHPNLLLLRRPWNAKDKRFFTAILVSEVRRLQSFFGLSASRDAWRVVIVDKVDDLNENAANALLKSLEEPPQRCVFLLISSAPAKVLTTIRSRCRRLDMGPVDPAHLTDAVQNACHNTQTIAASGEALQRLTALSEGSVRRALELQTGNGLDLYSTLLEIFTQLPKLNMKKIDTLAEKLGTQAAEPDFHMFFSLFTDIIHRIVRHAAIGHGTVAEEGEIARRLIRPDTLAQWAELWETVGRMKADVQALNLDRKILILETIQRLKATAAA